MLLFPSFWPGAALSRWSTASALGDPKSLRLCYVNQYAAADIPQKMSALYAEGKRDTGRWSAGFWGFCITPVSTASIAAKRSIDTST